LADIFAQSMADYFRGLDWQIDLITPVPLSRGRKKQRGYNQAALLAKPMAWTLGHSYEPKALRRQRETRSQVGLSRDQRQENVAGAFRASPDVVSGKAVMVVDDITTSGSTLVACADALSQAGAEEIYGLTLARAVLAAP
jgi:ComF family protein